MKPAVVHTGVNPLESEAVQRREPGENTALRDRAVLDGLGPRVATAQSQED